MEDIVSNYQRQLYSVLYLLYSSQVGRALDSR